MAKWKWFRIAAWCCLGLFFAAVVAIDGDVGMVIGLTSLFACIVFVIVACVMQNKDPVEKAKREEKRQKALEAQEERKVQRERDKVEREYRERAKAADKRPVEATLITTSDRTKTTKSAVSAAGRAIVGGVIAGPAGAVLGAATTSGKTSVTEQRATFFVKYASGRTGTETVKVGSDRFNELAAVMK